MKAGIVQFAPTPGEPATNRREAEAPVAEVVADGADLVVLPELFTVGYFAFDAYEAAAEPFEGPTLEWARRLADTHDVAILAGSFVEDLAATESIPRPTSTGLANTSALIDEDGEVVCWYRKRHLFGYESEEATLLAPGESLGVGTLGEHVVGLTTCYDLRFPELYRRYLDAEVTLMLVPSAWPTPRGEHWRLMCRARAIENQWYLVAANGAGTVAGTDLLGESLVVDPWGKFQVHLGSAPATATASTPRSEVDTTRRDFPILDDRTIADRRDAEAN